jgi:hypothetical protein
VTVHYPIGELRSHRHNCCTAAPVTQSDQRHVAAPAHKILVAAYHMLAKGLGYRDLGEAYLDQIDQTRTAANLKRRLE